MNSSDKTFCIICSIVILAILAYNMQANYLDNELAKEAVKAGLIQQKDMSSYEPIWVKPDTVTK